MVYAVINSSYNLVSWTIDGGVFRMAVMYNYGLSATLRNIVQLTFSLVAIGNADPLVISSR